MNDIIACPSCQRQVTLPVAFYGKQVQCPQCRHTFVAQNPSAPAQLPPRPAPRPDTFAVQLDESWDDDTLRRPRSRRRGFEDDDDANDFVGLQRPLIPHRGPAILTLGILSLVIWICAPVLGPIAWIMGYNDLRQIRSGGMDRAGEGMTQAGMIIGMITTILAGIFLSLWCLAGLIDGARF